MNLHPEIVAIQIVVLHLSYFTTSAARFSFLMHRKDMIFNYLLNPENHDSCWRDGFPDVWMISVFFSNVIHAGT